MNAQAIDVDKSFLREQVNSILMHPWFIPLSIIIALMLRLSVAVLAPIVPMSDGAWYLQRATELAAGVGFQEGGFATAYWPVGYPAILAGAVLLVGSGAASYVVLNLIAAGVVMLLIIWFARALTCNELVARLALAAYAIYPNHIVYTGQPMSEVVYTALYMSAFALLIKYRHRSVGVCVAGFVFGVATLVKSQTILFPVGGVIALWLIFRGFRWTEMLRIIVIVYASMLLIVLPWSARNMSVFDKFVLVSTNGGVALLIGANDFATGDHMEPKNTPLMDEIGIPWEQRVPKQIEWDARHKELAVAWIKDNPGQYLALMPKKIALIWLRDTDGFWAFSRNYPNATLAIKIGQWFNQTYYSLILLLALPCAFVALRAQARSDESASRLGLLFCMPIFVTLLAAIFTGQIRYHFPAMPMMIVAAAWTFINVPALMKNKMNSLHS